MNFNERYLAEYIAEKLHTLVCVYTREKELLYFVNRMYNVESYQQNWRKKMEDFLLDLSGTPHDFPILSTSDKELVWCTVPMPERLILVGPVRFFIKIGIRRDITLNRLSDTRLNRVRTVEIPEFASCVLLLRNLCYEKTISENDFLTYNCNNRVSRDIDKNTYNTLFENYENETTHNSYAQEERMLSAIETGNMELLMLARKEDADGEYGIMAPNMERSFKNICIAVVTLASRAAIRGGLHPELAFSLCDSFVMEIEHVSNLMELGSIAENAKLKFCAMVKELKGRSAQSDKTSYHPLVSKAKDYIFRHLHEKIVLQEVADELHVNPNYLSLLFKKCESVSFSDFVMREKVSLSKSMLIYSTFSFAEIAMQLGFVSQSHFGMHFRAITGMTPKQFRDRFQATATRSH